MTSNSVDEPMPPTRLARTLAGKAMPPLTLESTGGSIDLRELAGQLAVLFIYPHATGLPEVPVPGWESIPGALGCTAESCGFRDRLAEFEGLGALVAGLSVQSPEEQRAFAERVEIRYRLISDPALRLAAELGLPTFSASGRTFYKRLTLVMSGGRIGKVFYPIVEPAKHADDVLAWVKAASRK
jgi:peroxiredoxin